MRHFRLLCLFLLWSIHASASNSHYNGRDIILDINYSDAALEPYLPKIQQLADAGFSHYLRLFGGLPRDEQGKTYRQVNIAVSLAAKIGGEADPGIIKLSIADKGLFGYASWQSLLLHELFHLWNAESFRYADIREQWFNEGFTDFYAYQTLAKLGLTDLEQALQTMALPMAYYSSFAGRGTLSIRDAASDSQRKIDNYYLVYNGGWLAAVLIDQNIRQQTANAKSLDDVMRWMYLNLPRHQHLYSLEEIKIALAQTSGASFDEFIQRYIQNTETLPLQQLPIGKALWALAFTPKKTSEFCYLFATLGFDTVPCSVNFDNDKTNASAH